MFRPEGISERMMYNTVRLVAKDGGCGTGSFFDFNIGNTTVPVIITNKHVVNNNPTEEVMFCLHTASNNGEPNDNISISFATNWFFHPTKDLCFCYIMPLFRYVKNETNKEIFYITNSESIIPTVEDLKALSALEELVMVGYPIGLWDSRNNLPIFRKGYTANHPAIDFNEHGVGLVDMACFPGSSGSPIYIFNNGGYTDKNNNTHLGASRFVLLGYLYAGPQYSASGDVIVRDIPTKQKVETNTPIMVNLGYYVKSSNILDFKSQIEMELQKQVK